MSKKTDTTKPSKVNLKLTIREQNELFNGLNEISANSKLPLKFSYAAGRNAQLLKDELNKAMKAMPEGPSEKIIEMHNDASLAVDFDFWTLDLSMLPKTSEITPAFFALCAPIIVGELN